MAVEQEKDKTLSSLEGLKKLNDLIQSRVSIEEKMALEAQGKQNDREGASR